MKTHADSVHKHKIYARDFIHVSTLSHVLRFCESTVLFCGTVLIINTVPLLIKIKKHTKMPRPMNKKLGENALISTVLKNLMPVKPWKDLHPNDYRLKRMKFVVVWLGFSRFSSGKEVVIVKNLKFIKL